MHRSWRWGFCNETEQCLAGLYCNKEEKKCIHQKNEGEKCGGIVKIIWDVSKGDALNSEL